MSMLSNLNSLKIYLFEANLFNHFPLHIYMDMKNMT